MKIFRKLATSTSFSSIVARRRERQSAASGDQLQKVDAAHAHARLLMTMAAATGCIERVAMDEVLAYVDRVSLPAAERAELHTVVARMSSNPPTIDELHAPLGVIAQRPAGARMLVTDLARIVAATSVRHPRQQLMLDVVCEHLAVPNPMGQRLIIPSEIVAQPDTRIERERIDLGAQQRIRESVAGALQRSHDRGE